MDEENNDTLYDLKCRRSDKWVQVDSMTFTEYYDQHCGTSDSSDETCPECGEIHEN